MDFTILMYICFARVATNSPNEKFQHNNKNCFNKNAE